MELSCPSLKSSYISSKKVFFIFISGSNLQSMENKKKKKKKKKAQFFLHFGVTADFAYWANFLT